MHIHHHVSHGLHFSINSAEIARMKLSENGIIDAEKWDEIEYDDDALASSGIVSFYELDD